MEFIKMKLTLEIEESDNLQQLERVLSVLKPYLTKVQYPTKLQKIQDFLDFAERESMAVDKLSIPAREIRNAR
jgi:hypothetical protein